MIRIAMSIRPAEFVVALLVAVGVVVFGSAEEARADSSISEVCAGLDFYETSGWFCERDEICRDDFVCVSFILFYISKDRQIKIRKLPYQGGICEVTSSRCPGWDDLLTCNNWPKPIGGCL